jgi:hypothetical protein
MSGIGDIVLIYKDDQPAFFARIEDMWADKKPDWYHVKLLVLQVPVAEAVWILREAYINGEAFTMNGIPVRLEKVRGPSPSAIQSPTNDNRSALQTNGSRNKVISLFDRKKE